MDNNLITIEFWCQDGTNYSWKETISDEWYQIFKDAEEKNIQFINIADQRIQDWYDKLIENQISEEFDIEDLNYGLRFSL